MENLEEFVPIKGYEGLYEINRLGQVKNVYRPLSPSSKKNKNFKFGRILIGGKNKSGYRHHVLCKNGSQTRIMVHRLVALNFIPNPENKPQVNHKNGNKWDNHIENLEWCSVSENAIHSYKNGLNKKRQRIVICLRTGKKWNSIIECAKENNISYSTLSNKINGHRKNNTTFVYEKINNDVNNSINV